MLKLRLFRLQNKVSKETVLSHISEFEYNEDTGVGFELINDEYSDFRFEFVEKVTTTQEIETLDGELTEIAAVSYIRSQYLVRFNSDLGLIALNPPRSSSYPFQMVKECIFKGQKIEALSLNLRDLIFYLTERFEMEVKVLSLSNIQCDKYTLAKTKLVSTKCLLPYFNETYINTTARVDSLKGNVGDFHIEVSSSGRVHLKSSHVNGFLLVLDKYIQPI